MGIQSKVSVPRNGEIVHSERVEQLGGFKLARNSLCRADLSKAVGDEEDEDDEETVGWTLDLEVAEEGVGAEEVESLVNDIRL